MFTLMIWQYHAAAAHNEPASYSFVLHFPTFNCFYNHCHLPVYTLLFFVSLLSSFVVHFSFTPFSLSAIFSLFVCVCLFVCVDGIGLGSSPTSSQNEALPPSTDWPVSAYTSSFSLSSPETDDAGTWFIRNIHPPHCSGWITANQHYPLPPVTVTNRASAAHWRNTSPDKYDPPLSSLPVNCASHAVHISPVVLVYLVYLLPPCVWHGKCYEICKNF